MEVSEDASMQSSSSDFPVDNKNKHRISDARWRESVSRCYSLLKHCSNAQQGTTRMSILRLTLEEIQRLEQRVEAYGDIDDFKRFFYQAER